ncbi:MAG: rhomboid family intramembrane serine protease [Tissierellia bacterium]|nr:rhomboid family intramembrane serine protease [Tissierellia bacterium]
MAEKKIKITNVYIAINVLIFVFIYMKDPSLSTSTLIDFGALNAFSLADGRLLNLIMPMFLHASWSHLLLNCLSIHIFGRFVESFYGPKRFALISLAIGIFASLGSSLTGPKIAVGASGVIYGYIAFHLYLYMLDKERYKSYFGRDIFIMLAINLVYSVITPGIDLSGHVFGLIGGLLIYLVMDRSRIKKPTKVLALFLLGLVVGLSLPSIYRYKYTEDYYLSKIYYYNQKNKPVERDELIKEYLIKYPNQ